MINKNFNSNSNNVQKINKNANDLNNNLQKNYKDLKYNIDYDFDKSIYLKNQSILPNNFMNHLKSLNKKNKNKKNIYNDLKTKSVSVESVKYHLNLKSTCYLYSKKRKKRKCKVKYFIK